MLSQVLEEEENRQKSIIWRREENLVEENNVEICKSNGNKICYNIKKNTDVIEDKDIDTDTESLTAGTPISFHSDTPRKKGTKKNPDTGELFIDSKMYLLHEKDTRYDNFHICHQLNLQPNEQIKFQNIAIDHLRRDLKSQQKNIENCQIHQNTAYIYNQQSMTSVISL